MRILALWNGRRGYFEARRAIPTELRPIIGKSEYRENVGAIKREAERRALALHNRWQAELDEASEKLEASKPTLSMAAKTHYRAELEWDDRERAVSSRMVASEWTTLSRSVYANKLRLLVAGQVENDEAEALIGYAADNLIAKSLAPDVPRPLLLRTLAEVQLEALARFEERDEGRVKAGEPRNALLTEPDLEPIKDDKDRTAGKTLADILIDFHKERGTTLAERTIDEHKRVVDYFQQVAGELPARSIQKRHVLDFKQALLETPAAFDSKPDLRGLTLPQAIKVNRKRETPYPTVSATTLNKKYLAHLKTIMQWATGNGYMETNPATGVRVDDGKKAHREPTRVPFHHDDLKAIFGHAMFADPSKYETRQWALLLALHTGARSSSELARLNVGNVYKEQGVNVLNLSGATKNVRSKRLVPIHRNLLQLGFLEYVTALRERNETYVFPEWAANTKTINDWFGRTFLPGVGITDRRKVFHSFRHTFKTALARHGVPRDVQDAMTGHADHTAAAGYIHAEPIKAMSEGLNRVDFKLPIAGIRTEEAHSGVNASPLTD